MRFHCFFALNPAKRNNKERTRETIMKKLLTFRSMLGAVAIVVCLPIGRVHSASGDLYVAEPAGFNYGHVYRFTPAGDKSTFASGPLLGPVVALAFDRAGNLFVGNNCGCSPPMPSTVVRIAPDGTQSTFATIQSNQLLGLAFDGAGNLFVSTGQSILKLAPNGTQSTFASQLQGAWPLAFDKSGNLYAGVNPGGSSAILKFAPDGTRSTYVTFSSGPSASIIALAFNAGGDLFVARQDTILKVRPDGSSTTVNTGNRSKESLTFDAAGTLFVGQDAYNATEPAILKFAPSGTSATFVTGPLAPSAFAFEPVTEKVRNISARGLVASGENVLIGGFIVGGNALSNNAVVVRAIGPSLSGGGVSSPLSDPVLELHDSSGAIIASNNDWQDTQKAQITASGLAPTDPRESAIFATLPAGNYTGVVLSGDNKAGIAVVEVYSVNQ